MPSDEEMGEAISRGMLAGLEPLAGLLMPQQVLVVAQTIDTFLAAASKARALRTAANVMDIEDFTRLKGIEKACIDRAERLFRTTKTETPK